MHALRFISTWLYSTATLSMEYRIFLSLDVSTAGARLINERVSDFDIIFMYNIFMYATQILFFFFLSCLQVHVLLHDAYNFATFLSG